MVDYNRVELGLEYFPQDSIGRPITDADIYVGDIDTDPEIVGNQKQLYVQEEDGTIVAVAQPMHTSGGGIPTYLGSPVILLTEGDYSIKVLNSLGVQIYYSASVAKTASAINAAISAAAAAASAASIDIDQPLKTTDSPTFAGLTLNDNILNPGHSAFNYRPSLDFANIPTGTRVIFNLRTFDNVLDFNNRYKAGTTDDVEAFKLHDAGAGFLATDIGAIIYNTTDGTQTTVAGWVDEGEITLTHDIMALGESYILYHSFFLAPINGIYLLSAIVQLDNVDIDATSYSLEIVTSARTYSASFSAKLSADFLLTMHITVPVEMDADDIAYIVVNQTGGAAQADILAAGTWFGGSLICGVILPI